MTETNGSSEDYPSSDPYAGGGASGDTNGSGGGVTDPGTGPTIEPAGGGDAGVGYAVTCTCGDKSVTVYCATRESANNATCDCSDPRNPRVWCG